MGLNKQRAIALILTLLLELGNCGWIQPGLATLTSDANPTSAQTSIQPYVEGVTRRVTEFTLKNGLKFIGSRAA